MRAIGVKRGIADLTGGFAWCRRAGLTFFWIFLAAAGFAAAPGGVKLERPQPRSGEDLGEVLAAGKRWQRGLMPLRGKAWPCAGRDDLSGRAGVGAGAATGRPSPGRVGAVGAQHFVAVYKELEPG
jgi:hypothetical protein